MIFNPQNNKYHEIKIPTVLWGLLQISVIEFHLKKKIVKGIYFLPNRLFRYCKHTLHHRLIPTGENIFHPCVSVSDNDDALILIKTAGLYTKQVHVACI